MAITNWLDYFNGISAVINVLFGLSCGFYFLVKYAQTKKGLLPLVGLLFLGLGCFYSGPATSFVFLLFGTNISGPLYAYLSYSFTPLTMIVAMILGFNIFKNEWRFKTMWVLVPVAVLFWVFFYVFPELTFEYPEYFHFDFITHLMDVSFVGVGLVIQASYILGAVGVLGGGFIALAVRIRGSPEYKKAVSLGIGWVFFGVSGALDALLSEAIPIIIAPARALMLTAYILMFLGFKPNLRVTEV
ncbi:MAG: hypothetical protein ACTSRD_02450 [Promethearchaeota archaeon]